MDKELKATQQILRILRELDLDARANVLSYVHRRVDQEQFNDLRKGQELRIAEIGPATLTPTGVGAGKRAQ